MTQTKHYFFCGIGGSGMLPLALIVQAQGHVVKGSDRSLDQGHMTQKFAFLRSKGIELFAQDGSGVCDPNQILVASAAVEDTVPDIAAANRLGLVRLTRADLLAELFNGAPKSIAVGGTSGKSTTTGMIGWILHRAGLHPTVMNGAIMKNFITDDTPFASAVVGRRDMFVSEVDESDGSIAMFDPTIAVLNNVAVDHKPMEQLRELFGGFVARSQKAVLNLDNDETAVLAERLGRDRILTYSRIRSDADYSASLIVPEADGIRFRVTETAAGASVQVKLEMPGQHNVSNSLAALCAARACGVSLEAAGAALTTFSGIRRRLELVGRRHDITIIDDFAHNPDKIAASLSTLHDFPGRLLIMFQPHGFGPLRLMKDDFIACFCHHLQPEDVLLMPEPVYFGGTVDRSVSAQDLVQALRKAGLRAEAFAERSACGERLMALAEPGDRILVMGARDDTLSQFAADLLERVERKFAP